jgi:hypothetical protein
VQDKSEFINYEIRRLDDYVIGVKIPTGRFKNKVRIPARIEFIEGYERYLKFKEEINWGEKVFRSYRLEERLKGIYCAKYREFLNTCLNPKRAKKKTIDFSHDQQIMILDYLDFFNDLDNATKGKLYGPIIGRDSETTRQRFSTLDERKKENNLNQLLSYFTELGFEEQIERVKKDIEEIKRRKNSSSR